MISSLTISPSFLFVLLTLMLTYSRTTASEVTTYFNTKPYAVPKDIYYGGGDTAKAVILNVFQQIAPQPSEEDYTLFLERREECINFSKEYRDIKSTDILTIVHNNQSYTYETSYRKKNQQAPYKTWIDGYRNLYYNNYKRTISLNDITHHCSDVADILEHYFYNVPDTLGLGVYKVTDYVLYTNKNNQPYVANTLEDAKARSTWVIVHKDEVEKYKVYFRHNTANHHTFMNFNPSPPLIEVPRIVESIQSPIKKVELVPPIEQRIVIPPMKDSGIGMKFIVLPATILVIILGFMGLSKKKQTRPSSKSRTKPSAG